MTFEQAVEKIREKLKDADCRNLDRDLAVQINLKNRDCHGTMYIAVKDGVLEIEGYDYQDHDADLTLMLGALTKIIDKRLNPARAAEHGTIQVKGDMDAVIALGKLV